MAAPSEIEKLERRYAENPDGRFFAPLADAYRKAGNLVRALELVRAGLGKHPDYLSAHIVLGRCLLDKGDDLHGNQAVAIAPGELVPDSSRANNWSTSFLLVPLQPPLQIGLPREIQQGFG